MVELTIRERYAVDRHGADVRGVAGVPERGRVVLERGRCVRMCRTAAAAREDGDGDRGAHAAIIARAVCGMRVNSPREIEIERRGGSIVFDFTGSADVCHE